MVDATIATRRSPINFRRLFAESVQDGVKDHADANRLVRPGYWLARFRKGGPFVPAMIAECTHEPGNPDNVLDTGPILIGEIAGEPADPLDVYAAHEKRPISEAEYKFQAAARAWCSRYAPAEAQAAPARKRVDLTAIPAIQPILQGLE